LTRVLIIDDDITMTDVLKRILEGAHFEVMAANTSIEGIEAIGQWKPDIVILDLIMPGMDGLQVCKAIRSFSDVPILVLSVIDKPETIAQVLDNGADDYLVKPVPSGILIAHLNKISRRARTGYTTTVTPKTALEVGS
jgi:two-component system KDP operon response regulator KdpE